MYVVGGFDGSRLNDMFLLALEKQEGNSDSSDVMSQSMLPMHNNMSSRNGSGGTHPRGGIATPTSAASGIM